MFVPFLTLFTVLLVAISAQADMTKIRREDSTRHYYKNGHFNFRPRGATTPTIALAKRSATLSSTSTVESTSASDQASATPTSAAASDVSSSAAAPSQSSTARATSDDITAYLAAHNNFRAQYNANPLVWDNGLAEYAQAWSDKCSFKHSGGPYGENLAAQTGNYMIQYAVQAWTDEVYSYDFSSGDYNHFTQVVWKSTTALGCAATMCTDLDAFGPNSGISTFYVCSYNPPGNVLGQFKENVEGVTCDC